MYTFLIQDRLFCRMNNNNEMALKQDYKRWKKRIPALYDILRTDKLKWPSRTIQWLPSIDTARKNSTFTNHVMYGTDNNANNSSGNNLIVAKVKLPSEIYKDKDVNPKPELFQLKPKDKNLGEIQNTIKHDGPVLRSRYMPQAPCVVATTTISQDVFVYHYTKNNATSQPDLRLQGHKDSVLSINWNTQRPGYLLSSSKDGTIAAWDINKLSSEKRVLEPVAFFEGHGNIVSDVAWSSVSGNFFASASADHSFVTWDTRNWKVKAQIVKDAHESAVTAVSFNPYVEHYVVTGGADCTVGLWDLRNLKDEVHYFRMHADEVFQLRWSPHHKNIFASASLDNTIHLSNLDNVIDCLDDDLSSDILFTHNGHMTRIYDFEWHPFIPWLMCSVSENANLQYWKLKRKFTENVPTYTRTLFPQHNCLGNNDG